MHTSRDQLVKFIIERLTDLALTPRAVSLTLGKSPTYLADFLGKKASPKVIDEETRANLSRILSTNEDNLRFQRSFVKTTVGISAQDSPQAGNGRPVIRRANDMSMGDIYTKLGKLEQRIEQLEADRSVEPPAKGKRRTRP
jgi:AraC-like DNA-binding protein